MLNYISRRDHGLMRKVNRWPAPRWIRLWALCATRGGDGWLWYGMGAVILLFGGPMRFAAVGAAALAAAAGIAIFLTVFAYNLIGEALQEVTDPRLRESQK